MKAPSHEIVAPPSVFRALDGLSDDDYELVSAAILALGANPLPAHATKLRVRNAHLTLADGTVLRGPFLRIRCRSTAGGQSGGYRIIYVVDSRTKRVCLAKIARRDDDTYKALERILKGARVSQFG